ncbi:hypothetical protein Kpol_1036p73 [Vanderwaltozyma polyspora DSM 70294]|uniref:Structure-specific endonuclease subunit SLX4 n=1 Tax=Vanderwaltozyma polyspora (strain ATCC 22028 / DSM 70294 / BCRC 21397 / CBS 2163 / NBRC 10782 / NRRL Y-8283 / UCD 57-17) TaxID=436907 RepID=SLX4_VANPO|nr:uncharacterized protein Kpol_1036p73 [Vanderwaltozyma polyspora DSM 70294]A7TEM0.1 RecName: Full=Structure-specific endonuclease subunit SLX4 [Vanderwaltozyma polyspora DSM 70294]EDO19327.1 hypothetical protein Kpol_1036p73 [Vanderwaltozyma polyspora DSM 70294]
MDFRQAQRNLELIEEVAKNSQDSDEPIIDEDDLKEGKVEEEGEGTQIPSMPFSDDDDSDNNSKDTFKETPLELVDKEEAIEDKAPNDDEPVVSVEEKIATQEPEPEEQIFMNTQIQGQLDDIEQEDNLRSKLSNFKYASEESSSVQVIKRSNERKLKSKKITKPKLTKTSKRTKTNSNPSTQQTLDEIKISRSENILKLLSGKHGKVKDMINHQRNVEKKVKLVKNKNSNIITYDTYNSEEWLRIMKLILEKFPSANDMEVKQVYHYIYGEEQEQEYDNLWEASQIPLASMREEAYNEDNQIDRKIPNIPNSTQTRVEVMSLSQVMDDVSIIEESKKTTIDSEREMHIYEVPDSTDDEDSRIIRVISGSDEVASIVAESEFSTETESTSTQFFTADGNMVDGVIDLTQGSFKAVTKLFSPLKVDTLLSINKNKEKVQVAVTRTSTRFSNLGSGPVGLEETPRLAPDEAATPPTVISRSPQSTRTPQATRLPNPNITVMYEVNKCELQSSNSYQSRSSEDIRIVNQYDIDVRDSQDEYDSATEKCLIEFAVTNSATPSVQPEDVMNVISSQSVQKLRQDLKTIGLKPVRTKAKMIEALMAASQVLDTDNVDQEQTREALYDQLTSMIKQIPELVSKISRFEPITMEELVLQLIEVNPFADHIDESTIKEWADIQGITLRNN